MKFYLLVLLLIEVAPLAAQTSGTEDPLLLANPLVGTAVYGGALYPGAALPFSMVKLSPDTTNPSTAGYNPTEPIIGFSHTHIGGTGGAAFEGQIRVRPQNGPLDIQPPPSGKANEIASPGYYAVDLTLDHVRAELTCTERAGFHRYTFADGNSPSRILIDLAATINNLALNKSAGRCTGSTAHFVSDREIEGSTSIVAGYAKLACTVYFVATFDQKPTDHGSWLDGVPLSGADEVDGRESQSAGVYVEFKPKATVGLRVGISYTSVAQARLNLAPALGLGFDQVRAKAEEIWRRQLGTIAVEGGTNTERRQFYTAMYHSVLAPTDVTGDNNGWSTDSQQPVYWDIYTLWDTFRTTHPLLTLTNPDREREILRSLLAVYQKEGWLPDGWTFNKEAIPFQGGTEADNIFADAIVKGLGGFDQNLAYAALRKNATESLPSENKIFPGFGRLSPYFTLGYVPSSVYTGKDADGHANEYSAGTSRTLEYAYNDFCVSEVADALGHTEDGKFFRQRALGVYSLFNPATRFFWGKTNQAAWIPDADPSKVQMGWNSTFYEGSAWQYRFFVPHDVQGLINHFGGNTPFLASLDEYFDRNLHWQGNEPGFLTPWLHVYAGRPDKNVDRVRAILSKDYKLDPSGYPGDEDVGAMSAWYLFGAMGFYPNAGQDVYLLASPIFTEVTIQLGQTGHTFVIRADGLTPENKYVQSATLNGQPWDKAWFRHRDISGGAVLILKMGPTPSDWGTKIVPPSLTPASPPIIHQ